MRPSSLLYLYVRRLRVHGVQEVFAAVGIAIAVALVFAAMLAEQSISGSADRVVRTVIGPAQLQLRARGGDGFDEALFAHVKRLPGVERAGPELEQTATLSGPDGRTTRVQVAGADLRLTVLDGLAETLPIPTLSSGGIGLSRASADALGLGASAAGSTVTLELGGSSHRVRVSAVLGPRQVGALAGAAVALMPLRHMQRLAGLPGMVTRVFVQARPGRLSAVRAGLERLAGGRLEVAPASSDEASLAQALGPSDLASGLFAAIGALLGFLLAFNAMLLTVSDRRKTIADLRVAGASRASIVEMVLFEALCLGLAGSLAGLLVGYLLSVGVFHQSTGYLAEAFTLSGGTVVSARAVALALGGGVLATCLACSALLLDLRGGRARDAIYREGGAPGNGVDRVARTRLALAALCLLAGGSVLWLLSPAAAIPATALLALATVLTIPLAFAATLAVVEIAAERMQWLTILPLALSSLRATTIRSLALAATGAVALFGSVALGGSRANLLAGIHSFAAGYVADADVWVSNPGDNQAVDGFPAGDRARQIARVPGVAGVRAFQGGFLRLGARSVWVIARPPGGAAHVLATQTRGGDSAAALARLAAGGWIAVSEQIAAERHIGLGATLVLPTPTGRRTFRIAATTTNLAWPPGVIFMNAADYKRDWASEDPSALAVTLRRGANPALARTAIERALGSSGGLEVSLPTERAAKIDALASQGLGQLRAISTLLLLAAIVAMSAALGSSIWQRRGGLAALRLLGARPVSLQGILLLEAMLMLGAGCLTGALAGLYGQIVIDGFLRHVTGFPLASATADARPLEIVVVVLIVALAIGAIPGWLASRVRPVQALVNE